MTPWVKNLELSQLRLGSLLWHSFELLHATGMTKKKKKKIEWWFQELGGRGEWGAVV